MERNILQELDELKNAIAELQQAKQAAEMQPLARETLVVAPGSDLEKYFPAGVKPPPRSEQLADEARALGFRDGIVKIQGLYTNKLKTEGGNWGGSWEPARLLELDSTQVMSSVEALGDRTRLDILKVLLEAPCSAAGIVEKLGLKTTGKAYHHLNILENHRLVTKDQEGVYHFLYRKIGGLLAILAGVQDWLKD